jgi:hypothetical protein
VGPYHVEAFPNNVSKVLAAHPVSIGLRSVSDVRSLEHIANLCPVATRGLVSDQSASASWDSLARFHRLGLD